ncbi:tripartite tricarboxylate transporter TctB family protein [Devosia sp. A449]
MRIANVRDFCVGLLYLIAGVTIAIGASSYRMGVASSMGPGYFPFWIGILLALTGLGLCIRANMWSGEAQPVGKFDLRVLLAIIGAVASFGLLLPRGGIIVAVVAVVAISSLASRNTSVLFTAATAIALSAISVLVFVVGLGLRFPVFPRL